MRKVVFLNDRNILELDRDDSVHYIVNAIDVTDCTFKNC